MPSVAECSSFFQFSPLRRDAHQIKNLALYDGMLVQFLAHCDGTLSNFLTQTSMTECPPIFNLALCDGMLVNSELSICGGMLVIISTQPCAAECSPI